MPSRLRLEFLRGIYHIGRLCTVKIMTPLLAFSSILRNLIQFFPILSDSHSKVFLWFLPAEIEQQNSSFLRRRHSGGFAFIYVKEETELLSASLVSPYFRALL